MILNNNDIKDKVKQFRPKKRKRKIKKSDPLPLRWYLWKEKFGQKNSALLSICLRRECTLLKKCHLYKKKKEIISSDTIQK